MTMRRKRIFPLASVLLLALVSSLHAVPLVSADEYSVDIVSVDDSQYPSVSAVINILDAAGRPVPGLSADSFQVQIDGQPARVDNLRTAVDADVSLAVALVVDVSGSMEGEPLAQARLAAADFVLALSPQDSIAVFTFGDNVSLVQDFTNDKEGVIRALDGLTAVGNTALYQAAAEASAKAGTSPSPRRVIILLSDGVDYGGRSTVSRDDSIAAVKAAAVPTYTIGLGSEIDREYLTAIAQASRARFLETPTAEGLSQLYSEIGDVLRSQYLLGLTSPVSDRSQPLSLELSVLVNGTTVSSTTTLSAVALPQPPRISLSGIIEGQELDSTVTVGATVEAESSLDSVAFLLDGEVIFEQTSPPYELPLDPASLAGGKHVLTVQATDSTGATSRAEMAFTVAAPASGGGLPLVGVGIALLVLLGGAIVAFALWRWRFARIPKRAVEVRLRPWSVPVSQGTALNDWTPAEVQEREPEVKEERLGKLTITSGAGEGKEFIVGSRPISIGSAPWCTIVLPEDDGRIGPEEARAWVHQSRKLVFHRLTRLSVIASEGASGGWLVLDDGDEITLGSHRLLFTLMAKETEEEQSVGRAIDEALKGFAAAPPDPANQRESA